jgi:hypothetical protein
LDSIISESIVETSYEVTKNDSQNFEEFVLFLQSEEVAQIIRKLFCYSLQEELAEPRPYEIPQIREQFIEEYKSFFGRNCNTPEKSKLRNIFDAIVINAEESLLDQLSPQLRAYEALEKFKRILDFHKLNEINEDIRKLKREKKLSVKEILEFEIALRRQMIEVHGKIIPPSFSDTKKLPIDNVYVMPNLYETDDFLSHFISDDPLLEFGEFLFDIDKTLVVGNPGAGKTTLTDKICYEIANRYDERLISGKWLSPIHVTIRKYSEEKVKHNYSITDYIEKSINSNYQLPVPKGAIEYMLINGRVLVIFDGLDELLEVGIRREIVRDIEAFQNRYPFVKILITSREVGYKRAPLSDKKFSIYKIAPFNNEQIKQYVTKWFAADISLNSEEKKNKIKAFLQESKKVSDLTTNPTDEVTLINKNLFTFLKKPEFSMAFFGIFWAFAVLLELGKPLFVVNAFKETPMEKIFTSRYQNPPVLIDQSDLRDYSINPDQLQIIREWQIKRLNFLTKQFKDVSSGESR